jgi:hypothetical protein
MTDAIKAATTASAAISGALKRASASTGASFDYLYKVAVRESSLNPHAKAKTSSAAGLFQFIEQTWLAAVKKYGASHGLANEAANISVAANGRYVVADPALRKDILDLRFDADKAAALAGELALENKTALENGLGRAIDAAELYAAHFLGPTGAKKLLSADVSHSAAALLPAAAKANRPVFYDGARERTVGEVIASFRRTIGDAKGAVEALGERIEKSLAPLLRDGGLERLAFDRTSAPPTGFETKGLSPFVLAVLQALDPRELLSGRDERDLPGQR